MPYIPELRRRFYEQELDCLLSKMAKADSALTKGEVTYLITRILSAYVVIKGKNYNTVSDVDGILGTAAKEFYRRVTSCYEDKKREENDPNNEVYSFRGIEL